MREKEGGERGGGGRREGGREGRRDEAMQLGGNGNWAAGQSDGWAAG